eukprot:1143040-Pelagomonas_calceolata.AAC.2
MALINGNQGSLQQYPNPDLGLKSRWMPRMIMKLQSKLAFMSVKTKLLKQTNETYRLNPCNPYRLKGRKDLRLPFSRVH